MTDIVHGARYCMEFHKGQFQDLCCSIFSYAMCFTFLRTLMLQIMRMILHHIVQVKVSSIVNEGIWAFLNLFVFVFFTRRFHTHKKHKTHTSKQKQKKQHYYAHKKTSKRRTVACLHFVLFLLFVLFVRVKSLCIKKKTIKRFKSALIPSFTILLMCTPDYQEFICTRLFLFVRIISFMISCKRIFLSTF